MLIVNLILVVISVRNILASVRFERKKNKMSDLLIIMYAYLSYTHDKHKKDICNLNTKTNKTINKQEMHK